MNKKITFRGMDHSSVLEEYANDQLARIEEFLDNEREPIFIELVLEAGRTHAHHRVELRVKTPRYYLVSNYEAPKMYDVIDRVVDVMYHELHEEKKKLNDKKRKADSFKGA